MLGRGHHNATRDEPPMPADRATLGQRVSLPNVASDSVETPHRHEGWHRKLYRGFSSWGSRLHLVDRDHPAVNKENIRPRAGGKLGRSSKSMKKLLQGDQDERLVMKEQIGEGTCGLVFRAVFNGCEVAVKVLKQVEQYEIEGTCPVDARDSLLRESEALSLCVHPRIVALLEIQKNDIGNTVMILELMKCTLEDHFDRQKSVFSSVKYQAPSSMVSTWAYDLAQAIQFLHALTPKLIHRDIKPNNVMLDKDLNCKLGDFGLCKTVTHSLRTSASRASAPSTGVGGYMMTGHVGTYGYMAPEVGPDAVDADGHMAAYNKIRNGARPSMEKLKTRYPEWIINLLLKCFFHNPVDRPTAVEIVDFVRMNQAQKSLGIGGSVLAVLARLPRSISARKLGKDEETRAESSERRPASQRRNSI